MIPFFPELISRKAIICYFVTLVTVSLLFLDRMLPLHWMLFGAVEVCTFFYFSKDLTIRWLPLRSQTFMKRLFWTALVIRLVYAVFAYFFYDYMTGKPFMFHSADEITYYDYSGIWVEQGFGEFRKALSHFGVDDMGEFYFTGVLGLVFGHYVMTARFAHCLLSALTCALIYRIGRRHFSESTARMAGIFCMLMPNLIFYCGTHLKETDMVFATVLFVDCLDVVFSEQKGDWKAILLALLSGFALFTFRTVLGAVGVISLIVVAAFSGGKIGSWWKRILLVVVVGFLLASTSLGLRIRSEVESAWERRDTNQEMGLEARSNLEGGNRYSRYASKTIFAPLIFTIPFASLVETEGQENQQMLHGGNFAKNILSGFVIYALVLLLLNGEWRKHTLPLAMMLGYLAVIALSTFAHYERFHQPALPFELMFAAYGVSQIQRKQVKWIDYWMILIGLANVAWAWFKLAGRGLV